MPSTAFPSSNIPRILPFVTAAVACFSMVLWAPGASAAAGCDTVTPSIGQTISCTSTGTETIIIPAGANQVLVRVVGGGGGGGSYPINGLAGGDGGAGAQVDATFEIPAGETALSIQVGGGGSGGTAGGSGGGFSRILGQTTSALLVLAGGGGGGGQSNPAAIGGSGAAAGMAAGGSGATGGTGGGGTGGVDANAGIGGVGGSGGLNGSPYDTSNNTGGQGGFGGGGVGGSGGAGYGGGGGGGSNGNSDQGGGGAGGSYANATYLVGTATFAAATFGGAGGSGGASSGQNGQAGNAGVIVLAFTIYVPPASGSETTSSARSIALTFALPSNVTCAFANVESSIGSWIELPSAQDCTVTSRTSGAEPTLLGWATNAEFPLAIAQRQVDNGWGAYETFNENGQLTGVFIPAGGYTVISNDTNLYPILSN